MLKHYSNKLSLSSQGIWEPENEPEKVSYPEDGHQSRVSLEENSFWFNHRNNCIIEVIKRFPTEGVLFDIGGGNGFVSLGLQRAGIDTVLVEPGPEGAKNAKSRGLQHVVCASFQKAEFKSGTLSAIGVFDVVEHIENDQAFLTDLHDKLMDQGRLYLTVPAFQSLWSAKDIHEGHFRRYTIDEIREKLSRCGFELEYANYFFSFLLPPIFLLKALPFKLGFTRTHNTAKGQQEHTQLSGIKKAIIDILTRYEINKIKNNQPISFGSSVIVVAKRNSSFKKA